MLIAHPEASIATLCEPIHDVSDIDDPNQVKLSKAAQAERYISLEHVFRVIQPPRLELTTGILGCTRIVFL